MEGEDLTGADSEQTQGTARSNYPAERSTALAGAADAAAHQHPHTQHMFKWNSETRRQNAVCRAAGCLGWGSGWGVLTEETGIFTGKTWEQREDTQHTGHGRTLRGAREENIPWPSTYQHPLLQDLLRGFGSQGGRVG